MRTLRPARAGLLLLAATGAAALVGCGVWLAAADQDDGTVHWSDAIAASAASREVTVTADVLRISTASGCGALSGSPHVQESATRVTIAIDVVRHAAPPGVACGSDPFTGLDVAVHLQRPLGSRRLVDALGGARHGVLLTSAVPTLHDLPAGMTLRGLGWDERTGVVSAWWRNAHDQQIDLTAGPATAVSGSQRALQHPTAERIGASAGELERDRFGPDGVQTTVVWSPSAAETVRLEVLDQAAQPLGAGAVLALARGYR